MARKNETPQQTFQNTTSEEVKPRFWPPQARKFWYFSSLCGRFLMVFWLITSRISKKNRLRRAYCSRRWKFCGLRALQRVFCLTKWAPQAKILRFESATKGILSCKMSAAGGKNGLRALLRGFYLTNERHRRKFWGLWALLRGFYLT